ncbi:BLOC-1-related complex subunit 6 [Aplysia californica]|uniref:BLOC-1-related complex subunit 6 n=1 Tax=Aplysia californica TaxID=6500 RepID=A0ABM0JEM7_APLCA|nr:BLOC-1-related complex subunit 6 [Aplysia californica]
MSVVEEKTGSVSSSCNSMKETPAFPTSGKSSANVKADCNDLANSNHVSGGTRDSDLCPNGQHDDMSEQDILSPDISLSSQTTLRYSDVEPELKEHDKSHESSDSIETLEDLPAEDSHIEINQKFLQHLTLTQNVSGSSLDSFGKTSSSEQAPNISSLSDDNASSDSHEVIPEFSSIPRPESLSLPRPLQTIDRDRVRSRSENSNSSQKSTSSHNKLSDDPSCSEAAASSSMDKSAPLEERGAHFIEDPGVSFMEPSGLSQGLPQGTITRRGDMIQFVADDLTEKIKLSSPKSQADSESLGSRRSSVRSIVSASSSTSAATSSGISRSPSSQWQQSPDDIPPIDVAAVAELEGRARRVADSLDLMMGNIRNNLHKMSAITIGCQEAYKRSVDITCDSVDGSIKAMYALMAKCEELSTSMKPVEQLAGQIKEIKRILELFESQLGDS